MTVAVKHVYTAENLSAANPTISVTDAPAAGDVLVLISGDSAGVPITAVSGCGATWTKVSGFTSTANVVEAFVGTGATSSGTVTATTASTSPRTLEVLMVSGLSSSTAVGVTISGTGTQTTAAQTAAYGQLVIGAGWSDNSADCLTAQTPSTGWTVNRLGMSGSTLFTGVGYRIPAAYESHTTSANRTGGNNTFVSQLVLGSPPPAPVVNSVATGAVTTAANPTVALATTPAAGDVLLLSTVTGATGDPIVTAVSGAGATWSRVPGGHQFMTFWVGTGATSSGTITATAAASTSGRVLRVHHVSNVTADVTLQQYFSGFPVQATPSQLVIGAAYSLSTTAALSTKTPTTGWTDDTEAVLSSSRRFNTTYTVPSSTASFNLAGQTYSLMLMVGSPVPGSTITKVNGVANSSFETSTTGWNGASVGVLNSSATQTVVGTKSLTGTSNGANTTITGSNGGPTLPVVAGVSVVTLSAYVYASAARTVAISAKWLNAQSGSISTDTGTGVALVANTWTRITYTATAPLSPFSAFFVVPNIVFTNSVSGDIIYIDGAMAEYGSSASTYWDGATATAGSINAFTGSSNLYTSVQTTPATAPATPKTITSAFSGAGSLTSSLVRPARTIASAFSGSGALTSGLVRPARTISSALSGSGTLSSAVTRSARTIASAFSGEGTLSSALSRAARTIASDFSGSGSLSSDLVRPARTISSSLSGSGTLSSHLGAFIQSAFSGSGTLSSALSRSARTIDSALSGTGTLTSALALIKRIDSAFEGSGTLTSILSVPVPPGTTVEGSPLGKLASFTISTAAVKLNPAEGSGATPSVSAVYTKGSDPEFALGETNVLTNGAVGTYEGEIVRLNLPANSGNASISTNTPMTSLNTEMQLRPFIDSSPGTWTAVRAIDYWTQQAGLFYDKVPGECVAYASGFGHTDCYGASTTGRFYEKLNTGTTDTQVINSRSVKTFGSAVTGTTAFHEVKGGVVIASLPLGKKFIFSIGVGLAGTGRTAKALWQFRDSKDANHTVGLVVVGSDGTVTATLGDSTIASASVPVNATYRLTLSLEKLDGATVSAKLTVHTDDLAGNGTLRYDGAPATTSYALPGVLKLWGIQHVSAGGSGSQMTRWGTYMSVADSHPTELPAVQKVLAQTGKDFAFVSGFFGNVWNLLNEFCTIARLDLRFTDAALRVTPRISVLSPVGTWTQFTVDSQRREKRKQVAVVNKQSKAVSTDDAVLWRSDSVIQVNAREVYQTTVTTPHSILRVLNPVAVSGIEPFPYVKGAGQYVVTGADGYIVAPGWWNDNGGKVEVSLTDKEGEIAIKITAPAVDTVRAPYRISEGAADRPALYVCGSGIVNDPKEIHVATGAKNAREGFDNVFDSPFVSGLMETYDTAMAMASVYSSGVAEVTYELPNTFETPSGLGQYPAGALVTDNSRNYRIMDASQTASRVSGTAVPHTTIGAYVASYPAGATIADEKARHAGRTIRQFNIKPLKGNS